MRRKNLGVFVALSFGCAMLLIGTVQAAFLAGKGSVSGTVTDDANKPVVGLAIRLEQMIPLDASPRGGRKKSASWGNGDPTGLQQTKDRVKVVGKGITDAQGKFNFPNIEEGSYTLVAGSKNVGWIYQEVNVKANEETKLDDLKLVKVK